jgi:hypothetical protein
MLNVTDHLGRTRRKLRIDLALDLVDVLRYEAGNEGLLRCGKLLSAVFVHGAKVRIVHLVRHRLREQDRLVLKDDGSGMAASLSELNQSLP